MVEQQSPHATGPVVVVQNSLAHPSCKFVNLLLRKNCHDRTSLRLMLQRCNTGEYVRHSSSRGNYSSISPCVPSRIRIIVSSVRCCSVDMPRRRYNRRASP